MDGRKRQNVHVFHGRREELLINVLIYMQGKLEEHEKLVAVLKEVDVVISVLAYPQVLDQFKILEAIKVAGNIKVFLSLESPYFPVYIDIH